MLKNILGLAGAEQLSKNDQKSINGGIGNWPCVSSNKLCGTGGVLCPKGQGCELVDDGVNPLYGICKCL